MIQNWLGFTFWKVLCQLGFDLWVSRWCGTFSLNYFSLQDCTCSILSTITAARAPVCLVASNCSSCWVIALIAFHYTPDFSAHMRQCILWPAVPAVCLMSVLLQNSSANLSFEASKQAQTLFLPKDLNAAGGRYLCWQWCLFFLPCFVQPWLWLLKYTW